MHADQMRLRQALLNLVSNASKFTDKGTVTIAARRASTQEPRVGDDRGDRHRHRHDARADGQAVPGVLPGRRLDHPQVRRHRPWARHQPALLPDDGRRHHGDQRAGPRLDLHHPPAGGGAATSRRSKRCAAWPRRARQRGRAGDHPGRGRRRDGARTNGAPLDARRFHRGHRARRPGRPATGEGASTRRHHIGHDDARHRRLDGARRHQGRPRTARHPSHPRVHRGRAEARLRARGDGLHGQAGGPRAAGGRAARHLRHAADGAFCWWTTTT